MKEIDKLRREIKADFALTLGLQGDMTKRLERAETHIGAMQGSLGKMEGTVAGLQEDVQQLQGHFQQLQGHFQQLHGHVQQLHGHVRQLHGDVRQLHGQVGELQVGQRSTIEVSRKIEGQLRKTGERFDKVLRVVTEEFAPMSELINLEARFEVRFAELERRLSA